MQKGNQQKAKKKSLQIGSVTAEKPDFASSDIWYGIVD